MSAFAASHPPLLKFDKRMFGHGEEAADHISCGRLRAGDRRFSSEITLSDQRFRTKSRTFDMLDCFAIRGLSP